MQPARGAHLGRDLALLVRAETVQRHAVLQRLGKEQSNAGLVEQRHAGRAGVSEAGPNMSCVQACAPKVDTVATRDVVGVKRVLAAVPRQL